MPSTCLPTHLPTYTHLPVSTYLPIYLHIPTHLARIHETILVTVCDAVHAVAVHTDGSNVRPLGLQCLTSHMTWQRQPAAESLHRRIIPSRSFETLTEGWTNNTEGEGCLHVDPEGGPITQRDFPTLWDARQWCTPVQFVSWPQSLALAMRLAISGSSASLSSPSRTS